jgi:hypothetical protein
MLPPASKGLPRHRGGRAGAEAGRGLGEAALLLAVMDAVGRPRPGLHLDGDDAAGEGDQEVDLTGPGAHIAGKHPGPAPLQESGGDDLAEAA